MKIKIPFSKYVFEVSFWKIKLKKMGYKVKKVTGELGEYVFDFGGLIALRNFTARTNGNRLIIQSAENANFTILDALVNEVEIDGVVYDDVKSAQEALQKLVFNPNPPVILKKSEYEFLKNVKKRLEALEDCCKGNNGNGNAAISVKISGTHSHPTAIVSNGKAPFSYSWEVLSGCYNIENPHSQNPTIKCKPGSKCKSGKISVRVMDANNDSASATSKVNVDCGETINTDPEIEKVTIGGNWKNPTVKVVGGTAPFNYKWSCNDTCIGAVGSLHQKSPEFECTHAHSFCNKKGRVKLSVQVTDSNGKLKNASKFFDYDCTKINSDALDKPVLSVSGRTVTLENPDFDATYETTVTPEECYDFVIDGATCTVSCKNNPTLTCNEATVTVIAKKGNATKSTSVKLNLHCAPQEVAETKLISGNVKVISDELVRLSPKLFNEDISVIENTIWYVDGVPQDLPGCFEDICLELAPKFIVNRKSQSYAVTVRVKVTYKSGYPKSEEEFDHSYTIPNAENTCNEVYPNFSVSEVKVPNTGDWATVALEDAVGVATLNIINFKNEPLEFEKINEAKLKVRCVAGTAAGTYQLKLTRANCAGTKEAYLTVRVKSGVSYTETLELVNKDEMPCPNGCIKEVIGKFEATPNTYVKLDLVNFDGAAPDFVDFRILSDNSIDGSVNVPVEGCDGVVYSDDEGLITIRLYYREDKACNTNAGMSLTNKPGLKLYAEDGTTITLSLPICGAGRRDLI